MCRKKCWPVNVVADELGVTVQHVYTLIRAGRLEALDISESGRGGPQSIRITVDSVIAFKETRRIDPEKFMQ